MTWAALADTATAPTLQAVLGYWPQATMLAMIGGLARLMYYTWVNAPTPWMRERIRQLEKQQRLDAEYIDGLRDHLRRFGIDPGRRPLWNDDE